MKKVEHFVCETCGTMYNDSNTAAKCEAYHIKPKKVIIKDIDKRDWIPVTQEAAPFYKYPKRIKVQMADGNFCDYVRKKG